jgi:hypothetical protein
MTMTQQEMETIIIEMETTFKQPVNERPWNCNESGMDFNRYEHSYADHETQQFIQYHGVALWFKGVLVTTITRVDQWHAFKSVARLFSQVEEQEYRIDPEISPNSIPSDCEPVYSNEFDN